MNEMYEDLGLTYEEAAHGVQSAIKFEQGVIPQAVEHHIKHLRTGLDCRASDTMGLATLLIEKGVFTKEEYLEHIRLAMNTELVRYEQYLIQEHNLSPNLKFR